MAENMEKNVLEDEKKTGDKSHKGGRKKNITFISQVIISVWTGLWCGFQFYREIMGGRYISIWDFILSALAVGLPFSPTYISIFMDKIREIKLDKLIHLTGGSDKNA